MNKSVAVILGVVVVALIGAVLLQQQVNAELRAEILALRSDLQGVRLAPSTGGAGKGITADDLESVRRESRAEIARLREELAKAKKPAVEMKEPKPARVLAQAGALDITPVTALKNEGKATPSLALQTMVWAAAGGDVDALAGTIALDPEAQTRAQAMFDRLPEATRAQYGSPEKLVALFIAKDVAVVSGMQVTSEDVSSDRAKVGVLFQNAEGKTKQDYFGFRQSSDGWRLSVSTKAIDKFERVLSGGK